MNRWVWALAIGWIWAAANAAECGKIKFLEDRSRGVEVKFASCPGTREIAEGAILNLAPGARLWLKLPAAEGSRQEYQMVCQSRSEVALALLVESLKPPWVGSRSLKCGPWDGTGFACDGLDGKPKVFVCVAGELSGPASEPSPRKGASIVLRSLEVPGGLEEPSRRFGVLEAIAQEGRLCHRLYGVGRRFSVEWTVDAAGKVTEIAPDAAIWKASPEFADCLISLIRSYPYPKSSRTVFLNAAL